MVQLTFPTCCRGSLHKWRARGCRCWYFPSWFPFSSFSLVSSLLDRHFLIFFSSFCFCMGIFLDLSIEMNLVLLFRLPQIANSLIQQDPTLLSHSLLSEDCGHAAGLDIRIFSVPASASAWTRW
jgi:hypothetical protein